MSEYIYKNSRTYSQGEQSLPIASCIYLIFLQMWMFITTHIYTDLPVCIATCVAVYACMYVWIRVVYNMYIFKLIQRVHMALNSISRVCDKICTYTLNTVFLSIEQTCHLAAYVYVQCLNIYIYTSNAEFINSEFISIYIYMSYTHRVNDRYI